MTDEIRSLICSAADDDLPRIWAIAMEEMRRRDLVRSSNNPVADIAEALVAKRLGLTLAPKVARGYDAEGPDGRRYQVKSRRLTKQNASRQLGFLRKLEMREFDALVAVIFDAQLDVLEMWEIPYDVVVEHAKYVPTVNGHRVFAKTPMTSDPRVISHPV
ncbi:hypothetical protein HC251_24165 [Iamia sp. SCSIO 61187]|uniref:DUF6998 domain-containing protein n=1 Tax=Iamia sp. SCSIO 61187 TaxID=2722752 RepID=UPI001C63684B|nr:hypothetical protein [Iamia sp. SCSIO 61187]QYG95218.1 hypothetical protein HC251_24165 [Iamia sp. SCSIO 61187]